jgi:hypothetical protein
MKLNQFFATLGLTLCSLLSISQKTVQSAGTYTMELSRTQTMVDTEKACIEQAKLAAIAKEFGTVVTETTVNNTLDVNGQSDNRFTVLTRTAVKGEWLEDTEQPKVTWTCMEQTMSVTAEVHGKIRAFSKEGKVEMKFFTCGAGAQAHEKFVFKEGESLYAHLQCSKSGYVSVYYIDHTANTAVRLLPSASGQSNDALEIKADEEYILFDRNKALSYGWKGQSSELELNLPEGKQTVADEIVAVYTSEPYSKPLLKRTQDGLAEIAAGDFENWLIDVKTAQANAVVKRVTVTLNK